MSSAPPLVTAAWLAEHLHDDDVVVIDCSWVLGDPAAGRRLFEQAHVPGAAFADLYRHLAAAPAPPRERGPLGGRNPLPDRDVLQEGLRDAGVGERTHVVAYDQAMTGGAARLWWLLRHHGHGNVSVLAGGLAGWEGEREAGPPPSRSGDVTLRPGGADTIDVVDVLRGEHLMLDARAPERYRGEVEPVDPAAGHIPGAVNLPAAQAFDPPPELLADPRPLAAYCGSGVTACVVLLGLVAAGRDDARLYPGSWSDWVARGGAVETTPNEVGLRQAP